MRAAALLALALLLAAPLAGCLDAGGPDAASGDPVAFTLVDTDGVTRNRSDYAGQPVVLFMMATWCATCERKAPVMQELHGDYGDRAQFLGVDIDPRETDAQLERKKNEWGHAWPYAIDRDDLAARLNAPYTSTVVMLDGDGRVAFKEYNPPEDDMRSALDGLTAP